MIEGTRMPAERRPGMDHEHYEWSPINRRGALRWPNGARIALCVVVTLEKMEWETPPSDSFTVSLPGGIADRPFPDYARVSHREYGHRVGIFRVLDVLEKHGIPAHRGRGRHDCGGEPLPGGPLPPARRGDHRPWNFGQPDDHGAHDGRSRRGICAFQH